MWDGRAAGAGAANLVRLHDSNGNSLAQLEHSVGGATPLVAKSGDGGANGSAVSLSEGDAVSMGASRAHINAGASSRANSAGVESDREGATERSALKG